MFGFIKLKKSKLSSLDIKQRSLLGDVISRFKKNKGAILSLIILSLIILLVLFGPFLGHYSFDSTDWVAIFTPPSISNGHYFGTDNLGRDLFVRVLMGGRISFLVGISGALVAVIIGTTYGAFSGFIGGKTDSIMMRIVDILSSFPFMFFVIILTALFGRNIFLIFIAIGAVAWLDIARIVRGQTLSLKNREFVEAAYASGSSKVALVFRHIIPNVIGLVIVYATLLVPDMILFESFLSFLGLGVQEPYTSWGSLVNDGSKVMEIAPWALLFPGAFLVVTLFCFNFIGDGLRDALDPKDV